MAKRRSRSSQKPPQLPLPLLPTPTPTTTTVEQPPLTKPTKTLFCLSLLLFSLSLLSFVGTVVRRTPTTNISSGATSATANCACTCHEHGEDDDTTIDSSTKKELLTGYKILHHTLHKESQLRYLHWLRGATFRGPKGSLKTIMTTIYETSRVRVRELEPLLWNGPPVLSMKEAPASAIGDSIQNDVEATSTSELVPLPFSFSSSSSATAVVVGASSSLSQWGIRFLFIQAQATRMVVALATSLLKFEPNETRKQWLTDLAFEYEAIRESLVECLGVHLGDNGNHNGNTAEATTGLRLPN